jgi:hypothetical protein
MELRVSRHLVYIVWNMDTIQKMQNDNIPFRDRLLTPEQAAEWAGLSVRALMDKHRARQFPGVSSRAQHRPLFAASHRSISGSQGATAKKT